MGKSNCDVSWCWALGLLLTLTVSPCGGITDPRDVSAVNSLYAALGSPPLLGWVPIGGDPCAEEWQGVLCVGTSITVISLNGANLGGELGTNLDMFDSIIAIDLSNNHIGGTIPSNLPPTISTFSLSSNQFTGEIPVGLSSLSQLTDLSVNANSLAGPIPDAFQQLTGLINLDLSGNNLTGPLPPSMGNLTALTTLHLQDNKLTGTLNILEDLPLTDLNIENNLFSGPVPPKLLSIPNLRRTGNPFNNTSHPSPPASSSVLSPNPSLPVGSSQETPKQQVIVSPTSSSTTSAKSSNGSLTVKSMLLSVLVLVFILAIIGLGLWLCIARSCKKRQPDDKHIGGNDKSASEGFFGKTKYTESLPQSYRQIHKAASEEEAWKVNRSMDVKGMEAVPRTKDSHAVDIMVPNFGLMSSPAKSRNQLASVENLTMKPLNPTSLSTTTLPKEKLSSSSSLRQFTVALLQQYTNSFSQEKLIGEGTLGAVYKAEYPDGKLVAVKKLNNSVSRKMKDSDFVQLVSSISELQHPNIVKLFGYCSEYGQRLLVHEYCTNGAVFEALHFDDEIHKKLSWNSRIRIALGAAKALEYMHEICQPPVVHKNFSSASILLDDQMVPQVSECGLAPLVLDSGTSGYMAPELELGSYYTTRSDVFSFGVVMLELLTGRRSYDRSRPRGEQFLVRWAVHQLHDIDALSKMVDPSLNGVYPSKSLSRFADIISLCVQAEPEFRPPMSEIVQNLLKMVENSS